MFYNHCPKCRHKIPWYAVNKSFICRSCYSSLSTKIGRLIFVTVILWVLVDLPVQFFVANFIVRVIASGFLGLVVIVLMLARFARIVVDGAEGQ